MKKALCEFRAERETLASRRRSFMNTRKSTKNRLKSPNAASAFA